jgi:septal ring factor EnvC (AmiA/AmiB activator)
MDFQIIAEWASLINVPALVVLFWKLFFAGVLNKKDIASLQSEVEQVKNEMKEYAENVKKIEKDHANTREQVLIELKNLVTAVQTQELSSKLQMEKLANVQKMGTDQMLEIIHELREHTKLNSADIKILQGRFSDLHENYELHKK